MRQIVVATLVVLVLAFQPSTSSYALTITVCSAGCNFTTIGGAVNAAQSGDVITVAAGTYAEHLTIDSKPGITIQGSSSSPTIIDDTARAQPEPVIEISDTSGDPRRGQPVVLQYLTIQNGANSTGNGGGLDIMQYSVVTLQQSTVTKNSATLGGGAYVHPTSRLDASNTTFSQNMASGGGGLYVDGNGTDHGVANLTTTTVSSNSVLGTAGTTAGGGGLFASHATVSITGSTFLSNSAAGAAGANGAGGQTGSVGTAGSDGTGQSGGVGGAGGTGVGGAAGSPAAGGAVYASSGSVTIAGTSFTSNSAQGGYGGDGGAGGTGGQGGKGGDGRDGYCALKCVNARPGGTGGVGGLGGGAGWGGPGGTGGGGAISGFITTISITGSSFNSNRATGGIGGIGGYGATGGAGGSGGNGGVGDASGAADGRGGNGGNGGAAGPSGSGGPSGNGLGGAMSTDAFVGGQPFPSTVTVANDTVFNNSASSTAQGAPGGSPVSGGAAGPGGIGGCGASCGINGAPGTNGASGPPGNPGSPGVGTGGGFDDADGSAITLTNVTIAANTADIGSINGPVTIRNTILVTQTGGTNCGSGWSDGGHNLQWGDSSCGASVPTADPVLGPFQNNGGPTPTMALGSGSAAQRAGDPAFCAAPPVNNKDQRGIARPSGQCDIGAYDTGAAPTFAPVSALYYQRTGSSITFRWRMRASGMVTGFNVYAGRQRLTSHIIPSHSSSNYSYAAQVHGAATFRLETMLRDGRHQWSTFGQ